MGNASSSVPPSPILGDELMTMPSQRRSRSDSAYLVAGLRPQDATDVYSLDSSTDSGSCCGSASRVAGPFISREEALIKARYYKDTNPELAKKAYMFALNFPIGSCIGRSTSTPATNCGCSFVRCDMPQSGVCWDSSTGTPTTHPDTTEKMQKVVSAEAVSTAFTSGTVSRLHTDDLDELVVSNNSNPAVCKLHLGDVSAVPPTSKEDFCQFDDSDFAAEIHAELAQLHLMNGEPREALERYNSASLLAPYQLAYSYRKGVVLQQLGEKEKAVSCFRSVLQDDKEYKPALFNLGVCLAEEPETRAEALSMFELLLSIDPNNDNALDMIADIHEQEGRVAEAYAVKQRVVNLDPTNFRAGRELARLESTLAGRGEVPGYVTLN